VAWSAAHWWFKACLSACASPARGYAWRVLRNTRTHRATASSQAHCGEPPAWTKRMAQTGPGSKRTQACTACRVRSAQGSASANTQRQPHSAGAQAHPPPPTHTRARASMRRAAGGTRKPGVHCGHAKCEQVPPCHARARRRGHRRESAIDAARHVQSRRHTRILRAPTSAGIKTKHSTHSAHAQRAVASACPPHHQPLCAHHRRRAQDAGAECALARQHTQHVTPVTQCLRQQARERESKPAADSK
jgi:hypothetical protein